MVAKPPTLSLIILGVCLALAGCSRKSDPGAQATHLRAAFAESNRLVTYAISAIRTNDYPAAVIALESARGMPGITAEQLIAVQRAKEAMTADLVSRAEAGDTKAQADLGALERSRSQ